MYYVDTELDYSLHVWYGLEPEFDIEYQEGEEWEDARKNLRRVNYNVGRGSTRSGDQVNPSSTKTVRFGKGLRKRRY